MGYSGMTKIKKPMKIKNEVLPTTNLFISSNIIPANEMKVLTVIHDTWVTYKVGFTCQFNLKCLNIF